MEDSPRGGVPDEIDPQYLQPILHDTDGYYQIGHPELCTENFVLSITIAYGANLAQVKYE